MEGNGAGGEKREAREQGGKEAGRQGSREAREGAMQQHAMDAGDMFPNVLHFFNDVKGVLKHNL